MIRFYIFFIIKILSARSIYAQEELKTASDVINKYLETVGGKSQDILNKKTSSNPYFDDV